MSSSFICPQELNATTNDAAGDTMDEEFRRAQEMALAVTVLGSTCSNGGMTAVDIRQAVADVITERSDHKRSPARKKAAPPARKPKNNESSPLTTFTKPTLSPTPPFPMNLFSAYLSCFKASY